MTGSQMVRRVGVRAGEAWWEDRAIHGGVGVVAFAVMTALGAYVRIPLPWTPVPVTLQTFFVLLAGATLGPVQGAMSQALYLTVGAAGAPVFAGGMGGISLLLSGPTSGYLFGFVLAAVSTGWLVRRRADTGILWIICSMTVGTLVVYACGTAWLVWNYQFPLTGALAQGILPFVMGDAVKLLAAAGLARASMRGDRHLKS
jgi:biotin transport system substrate-specific component